MLNPKYGELSEWLKEHAWKVCIRQRIESSNLLLTATFKFKDVLGRLFSYLKYIKINNLVSISVLGRLLKSLSLCNTKSNTQSKSTMLILLFGINSFLEWMP